jgi:RNA 2',3'-cyclic 3'-phosphodiesterase
MLRLFVGISFPPELKLRLSLLCSGVPGAKWVDPGNFHLTLRFIGEIGEDVAAAGAPLHVADCRDRRLRRGKAA